jgi:hypothetical protein
LFRSRLPIIITVEPCAKAPPTEPDWIHEIKHDGFRIIARRDGKKFDYFTFPPSSYRRSQNCG